MERRAPKRGRQLQGEKIAAKTTGKLPKVDRILKTEEFRLILNPIFDDTNGELISLMQLARRLDVSRTTVWRWCFASDPPLDKIVRNGVWKTKVAWYNEWLAKQNQAKQ